MIELKERELMEFACEVGGDFSTEGNGGQCFEIYSINGNKNLNNELVVFIAIDNFKVTEISVLDEFGDESEDVQFTSEEKKNIVELVEGWAIASKETQEELYKMDIEEVV